MERLEYQARSGDPDAPHKKVPPIWVTDSMWKQCQHLDSSLPSFDGLCRSLITDHVHWELLKQMEDPFKGMQTSYKELSEYSSHIFGSHQDFLHVLCTVNAELCYLKLNGAV